VDKAVNAPRPAIVVLFGITGDLAQRKLLPALYHLFRDDLLHEQTVILGITRRDVTTEQMVAEVQKSIETAEDVADRQALQKVQSALRMHTMSQVDPKEYADLKQLIDDIETEKGMCMDRLYYLSIPPQMFGPIVRNLGEQGLNQSCEHGTAATRLLVEKPFGYDLRSAEELIHDTAQWFHEDQIFRIDHYIAKDAVQNILTFRQEYPVVEQLWNSGHIERIEINAFEKLDIEGRATFYEEVGAMRDFIESHLMQVLSLVLMDLPKNLTSETVHAARLEALRSVEPLTANTVQAQTLRAQYEGYREEVGNPSTCTETYASVTVQLTGGRWSTTTATLQTGKALANKRAEVILYFKTSGGTEETATFYIDPEKGIDLQASDVGLQALAEPVAKFDQTHRPSGQNPLGYERVFLDAIHGDHTIFTTSDEVLAAWRIVEAVVRAWSQNDQGLRTYKKGSQGVN
jgi:glucose-6-phosphate 1-dehydrogenase